jgi:hypothetical protein
MLKQVVCATALFGLLSSPSLAQQYVPEAGSGNVVHGPGGRPVSPGEPAYVGQRGGAYEYGPAYGAVGCRVIIHREWRHGHSVRVKQRVCR